MKQNLTKEFNELVKQAKYKIIREAVKKDILHHILWNGDILIN